MKKGEITKIIIEGPDCSGKSTLVGRLKNLLHWDSKSLHHLKGDQFQRYLKEYLLNEYTVYDRAHYSEFVYSQLWRGGSSFDEEELKILNYVYLRNSKIIFICPELSVLEERYSSRSFEQQIKLDELNKSREMFISVFENIPHIKYYSRSFEELENLLKEVNNEILRNTC